MVETADAEQKNKEGLKSDSSDGGDAADGAKSRASMLIEQYNLPDNYKIHVNAALPDLNSSHGKAFDVSDSNQGGDFYAILLPNSTPIRFGAIQKLRNVYHGGFCNVVDSGFVDISSGQFGNFAVVAEKPRGSSLASYMDGLKKETPELAKKETYFDEAFITQEIVEPLVEVIKALSDNGVSHGLINHNSIFIESLEPNRANLILKEPVSEPCGLSQYHQYEPVHRAQAMPLGKGEARSEDDYFALGVLVFYLLFGRIPGANIEQISFLSARLEQGSYSVYVGKTEVSSRMTDLLRGLLNDLDDDRWGYEQVKEWLKGKRFNLIKPTVRKEAVRAYDFKEAAYNNTRSLANSYYHNWDDSSEDIRSKKLTKWLELSVDKSIAASEIYNVLAGTGGDKSKSRREDDELVAKTLVILDPMAPIRYRNLSTHLDGLGAVLASAWHQQNKIDLQTFTEVLRLNLADFKAQRDVFTDKLSDRWLLQKLHNFITIRSYGFGVERCLYDLNEAYPCQSNLMSKSFIIDIKQLVYYLNDNATKLKGYEPVDRHIAAFIASKLDMSQEIKVEAANRFRKRPAKDLVLKIALLSYAQSRAEIPRLNGLCNWIVSRMDIIANTIKSKKLRKQFLKELDKVASNGSVRGILDFISDGRYFDQDRSGFGEAKNSYIRLTNQLRTLTDPKQKKMRERIYHHNGLYLAKVASVGVFIVIVSMTFLR